MSFFLALTALASVPALAGPSATELLQRSNALLKGRGAGLPWTRAELRSIASGALETLDPRSRRTFVSHKGLPLLHWVVEPESPAAVERTVVALTTIHGDELSAAYWGLRFLWEIKARGLWAPVRTRIVWVGLANPDGLLRKQGDKAAPRRANARGKDLNRNFNSSTPENETRWLKRLLELYRPTHVISVHAPFGWLDYDGPDLDVAEGWLERAHRATQLPRRDDFPAYRGSLGDYAGLQKGAHVLTWELAGDSVREGLRSWERMREGFLETLEP